MKIETGQLHDFGGRYTAAWCSQDPDRVAAFFSIRSTMASAYGMLSSGSTKPLIAFCQAPSRQRKMRACAW